MDGYRTAATPSFRRKMVADHAFRTVVIGAGPGGTGPMIWAAQNGLLEEWLDEGVLLVDADETIGGTIGKYAVNSDSLGRSYLESFDKEPFGRLFDGLRDEPATRAMWEYYESLPPLAVVGAYMKVQGEYLARIIGRFPRSAYLSRTKATQLTVADDGGILVDLIAGNHATTVRGDVVLSALGGQQMEHTRFCGVTEVKWLAQPGHLVNSEELLNRPGLQRALSLLPADPSVVVLGGSHSAFSAAWILLDRFQGKFGDGAVKIVHRTEPRVFYPTRADALAEDYPVGDDDICPVTQRVNRLSGLRGDGRDLWRAIKHRPGTVPEHRVELISANEATLASQAFIDMVRSADLVVTTFGYHSRTLPVFDAHGNRITLRADIGKAAVDHHGRMLLANGTPLPNLFGIGLGSGYRPFGKMGGERSFHGQQNSLWLYQNDVGEVVFRSIAAVRAPMEEMSEA